MKYASLRFCALALFVWSAGCLNLGTQTSETGGSGGTGGGDTASSSGIGGMSGCTECNFGRRYGDDAEQTVYSLAMGNDGSVFLTGKYNGAMFLGQNVGVTDSNGMLEEAFLAKLDAHGVPQWIIQPAGFGTTSGTGSAIAIDNNLVAWGGDVGAATDTHDVFIQLHSLSGSSKILASVRLGTPAHDELAGLALSSDGKTVYAAALLYGASSQYIGCPALGSFDAGPNPNLVVLALDSASLTCKWGKTWTGGNHNPGTMRIAVGADGNPFVAGAYSAGTLEGAGLPSGDGAFIMKLDAANGNLLKSHGFPNVLPLGLVADRSTDSIVIAGILTGSLTFAGTTQDGPVMPDTTHIAILAHDGMLQEKWFRPLAGSFGQFCQGISTDGAGRLYAGCIHQGALVLPNGPTLTCPEMTTMCGLLVTMNSANGEVFGDKCATYGSDQPAMPGATFLTAAGGGALAMGGSWIATITFPDGTPQAPTGTSNDYDVLIGKVDPAP